MYFSYMLLPLAIDKCFVWLKWIKVKWCRIWMVEYLSLDLGNIDSVVSYTNQFSMKKNVFFAYYWQPIACIFLRIEKYSWTVIWSYVKQHFRVNSTNDTYSYNFAHLLTDLIILCFDSVVSFNETKNLLIVFCIHRSPWNIIGANKVKNTCVTYKNR